MTPAGVNKYETVHRGEHGNCLSVTLRENSIFDHYTELELNYLNSEIEYSLDSNST